jgi:DNA polymerase-3 subunit epsilon
VTPESSPAATPAAGRGADDARAPLGGSDDALVERGLAVSRAFDRDVVCVDLETTGGNAAWHRIVEIGLVEIDRDGTVREWSQLVNPGARIPTSIEEFTGITNAMVADAPRFEDVYREVLERLSGRLFVAHNARFDYGFLRSEFRRLDVRWSAKVLCTVKLSRRLFPEHPRHNLDAVMQRHGLECEARHRALGDARVLRDLLAVLARDVEAERLATTVEALLQETPLPPQLPEGLADELPECAGVYRFYGEDDVLLYVGKSINVRHRVLEHFAQDHRSSKEHELSRQVRRIEWTETAGELGALLHEARAVKQLRPLHNRRLRANAATWTLRLAPANHEADADDATPAPLVAEIVELDALDAAERDEVYGTFKDRKAAARALDEIVRAHQLCGRSLGLDDAPWDGVSSCFAFQLRRCKGACVGREPAKLHDTRVRLALAGLRMKPWPYRGRIAVAERDWRGEQDFHVLEGWRWLGTVRELDDAATVRDDAPFDADIYRLLKRFLAEPGLRIVELG